MWNVEGEQPKGPSRVARIRSSRPGLLWWVYSIETRAEADLLKHGFLHDLAFRLVRLLIGLGILNVILPPSLPLSLPLRDSTFSPLSLPTTIIANSPLPRSLIISSAKVQVPQPTSHTAPAHVVFSAR